MPYPFHLVKRWQRSFSPNPGGHRKACVKAVPLVSYMPLTLSVIFALPPFDQSPLATNEDVTPSRVLSGPLMHRAEVSVVEP